MIKMEPCAKDGDRDEIPPGTLYLLILKSLAVRGRLHGYEIAEFIENCSEDVLQVEEGLPLPGVAAHVNQGLGESRMGV